MLQNVTMVIKEALATFQHMLPTGRRTKKLNDCKFQDPSVLLTGRDEAMIIIRLLETNFPIFLARRAPQGPGVTRLSYVRDNF